MDKTLKGIVAPSTVKEAFDEWKDRQSNGLSKSKALNALFEAGQNPIANDVDMFWKKKGKSGNDAISFKEFEELFIQLGNPKDVIKKALRCFDANENGKIDSDELRDILKAAGELENASQDMEDNYVALILKLGDRNENHELDIDELVSMIQDGLVKR